MKTETCKLYSRDFRIFLPKIIKIDLYNSELYRFKVGAFFETQCRYQCQVGVYNFVLKMQAVGDKVANNLTEYFLQHIAHVHVGCVFNSTFINAVCRALK